MNQEIVQAVEQAINQLADGFVANPCLHRVEHSLHCDLYQLLLKSSAIPKTIRTTEFTTRLIHKEWPEIKSHGSRKRRGNFDLAVLAPDMGNPNINEFRYGRLKPLVAIEVGLNYRLGHLRGDWEKLKRSGVANCYMIHFASWPYRDYKSVEATVKNVMSEEKSGCVKIAYVDHYRKLKRKLGESVVSTF